MNKNKILALFLALLSGAYVINEHKNAWAYHRDTFQNADNITTGQISNSVLDKSSVTMRGSMADGFGWIKIATATFSGPVIISSGNIATLVSTGTAKLGGIQFTDGTIQTTNRVPKSSYKNGLIVYSHPTSSDTKVNIEFFELGVESVTIGGVSLSTITVDITTVGAGGLDVTPEAANRWYAIYVVANSTGGYSAIISTSDGINYQPVLPNVYTSKRRVGWVRNDNSSNFRKFVKIGDRVMYTDDVVTTFYDYLKSNAAADDTYYTIDLSSSMPPRTAFSTVGIYWEGTDTDNLQGLSIRPAGTLWPSSFAANYNHIIGITVPGSGATKVRSMGRYPVTTDRNRKFEMRTGLSTTNEVKISVLEYSEED